MKEGHFTICRLQTAKTGESPNSRIESKVAKERKENEKERKLSIPTVGRRAF